MWLRVCFGFRVSGLALWLVLVLGVRVMVEFGFRPVDQGVDSGHEYGLAQQQFVLVVDEPARV